MRVLLITPVFYPEPYYLRGLPFAKELVRRGLEVEVLTGFPNYPTGKIFPGYQQRICHRETISGVEITRLPHYISHDDSGFRRALSYLSVACSMAAQGPFRVKRPDVIHVNQGHGTLALPADIIQLLRRSSFLLDIQDLWPESVLDSSMFRLPGGAGLLHRWCKHTYRRAKHILTLSEGVKECLIQRGVKKEKISVLYNWCDASLEGELPKRDSCDDPLELRRTFNLMYAGNIGPLQALGTVLQAAKILQSTRTNFRFVFIGSGLEEDRLRKEAQAGKLNNVLFVGRKPMEELQSTLAFADGLLVHLKDTALNRVGIPSKLQHCLAMGRPILIGAFGSASEIVRTAGAGLVFEPENALQLARRMEELHSMSQADRCAMGANGRKFYMTNMAFDKGIAHLIRIYERTAKRPEGKGK